MSDTFIIGKLLLIDQPNRNHRTYSRSCVEKIVEDFHERRDEHHPFFGELENPVGLDAQKINLDRASHTVEDIFIDGDFLKAKIKVLGTPYGEMLRTLHSNKVSVGFAMRGTGEVHENTHQINNFNFITVDVTGNPSTITNTELVDQLNKIMDSMKKDGLL